MAASQRGLQRLAEVQGLALNTGGTAEDTGAQDPETQLRLWASLMAYAFGQLGAASARQVAGAPVLRRRDELFARKRPVSGFVLLWPTYWPDAVADLLAWSLNQWREFAQPGHGTPSPQATANGQAQWQQMASALKQQLPTGLNPARVLTAAGELKRPVIWLERDTFQVGHGRRARWLRSTLTDSTSSIGVSLAKDKVHTNRLLRRLGVPVPQHIEVADAPAAVAAAGRLGWPVVVKPADKDRGEGARANLRTPEQVEAAYEHARQVSRRVLVEQYVAGQEYRLTVTNGKLFWAHERVPAAVVGDGHHTLQALIDRENAGRRQALLTDPTGRAPIQMDADNLAYLHESGRSLQDVPPAGESVRLQRVPAANTGGGGLACFDTIHPDNRLLAERAAQLLRLDIAGVDLIMPDITRSWREVGGAVTEVNAVPQVSLQTDPMLARRLLQTVVPHSGRIPLLFVLAEGAPPTWLAALVERLTRSGLRVGVTTEDGLQIGGDWIRGPRTSAWEDIRALQMDPSVGAIVVSDDGEALLQTGLPFDTVDALVVQAYRPEVLSLLMPYASGYKSVAGATLHQRYGQLMPAAGQQWRVWADSPDAVTEQADELAQVLLAAEAAYAQVPEVGLEASDFAGLKTEALEWLQVWQGLIANEDYDAARRLFDEEVVGFGTVAHRAQGLDQLVQTQWLNVWGRTRRFAFVPQTVEVWPSSDGSAMTVAVQWTSEGMDARSGEHYSRQGRATIVLHRQGRNWRARHTHFSLNPAPERFLPQP